MSSYCRLGDCGGPVLTIPFLINFKSGNQVMLPILCSSNYQFIQTPSQVKILIEMNHTVHTIRLKGEPLPEQICP